MKNFFSFPANFWLILSVLSIVVISTLFGVKSCENVRLKRDNGAITAKLSNCLHAPVQWQVKTVHDTVKVPYYVYLPSPDTVKPGVVPPASDCGMIEKDYYSEKTYSDVLKNKDFDLHWGVKVSENKLKQFSVFDYVVNRTDSIGIKVVDTCFDKTPKLIDLHRNHLILDIDLIGNNIKQFPNISTTLGWSVKDRFKLNVGLEYSAYHSELYGKVGIGIFLVNGGKNK